MSNNAIELNVLEVGGTATASSAETAILTPRRNRVYYVALANRLGGGGNPNLGTVSGWGLTWSRVSSAQNVGRIGLFLAGGQPTPGKLTFDFGGQVQENIGWDVIEIFNTDLFFPQVAEVVRVASGTGLIELPLPAFPNPKNIAISSIMSSDSAAMPPVSPEPGFSVLTSTQRFNTNMYMMTMFKANENTVGYGYSGGGGVQAGALEIKFKAFPPGGAALLQML